MDWKHPGRSGAIVYAIAASVLSVAATAVTRLTIAKRKGRATAVARLPPGPVIVISNHASHADGILLGLACRRMGRSIRFLTTSGVFQAPVLGPLVRRVGFIPVERGSASAGTSLNVAAEALAAGEVVGIFPEGRTTRDPNLWPERAKTGAVRLALKTGVPIVPIAMVGTHRVLPRKRRVLALIRNLLLRPNVVVEIGDPIDVVALAGEDPITPDRIRQLADQVMAELVALVASVRGETPPASPQGSSSADAGNRWPDPGS
ncbi:MAG: 1-acyl-sn-glycerol-3-phosphate acyltransferase, partial [Acidimicrobiia bacterium]|nr:1-acyl-sn-glycerol-3-phosphate acyltransferase [Acidimicrobiia bacterium]